MNIFRCSFGKKYDEKNGGGLVYPMVGQAGWDLNAFLDASGDQNGGQCD